jgi:hypothetical protein
MPTVTVGQRLAAAWPAYVGRTPYDQIFPQYWTLDRLKSGKAFKGFDGGTSIQGPIEYALNSSVAPMSSYDTVSTTHVDVFDQFDFAWKMYGGSAVLSSQEQAENMGSSKKFDLESATLENLKKSMLDQLSIGVHSDGTGTGSLQLGGLQHIVASTPTSGTVGSINRATYSFWRNQTTSGAKTTTLYDNLRSAMRTIYNACSNGYSTEHPEFFVMTSADFAGYESLLVANERFTDKSVGDGGFKNEVLKFKGALVAYDGDCPSATAYALNTSHIKLGYLNGFWMKGYPAVDPANQFVEVFKIETKANLFATNPRHLGVITSTTS